MVLKRGGIKHCVQGKAELFLGTLDLQGDCETGCQTLQDIKPDLELRRKLHNSSEYTIKPQISGKVKLKIRRQKSYAGPWALRLETSRKIMLNVKHWRKQKYTLDFREGCSKTWILENQISEGIVRCQTHGRCSVGPWRGYLDNKALWRQAAITCKLLMLVPTLMKYWDLMKPRIIMFLRLTE